MNAPVSIRTGLPLPAEPHAPHLTDKRSRAADVEALHRLQAARPLKPPPYDFGPVQLYAARAAARADRKAGVLV